MFLVARCNDERQEPYTFEIPLSSGVPMVLDALLLLCRGGYGEHVKAQPGFQKLVDELHKLQEQ